MILENHNEDMDDSMKMPVFDQLSENILDYMQSLNFEPPDDWEGYKPFDE